MVAGQQSDFPSLQYRWCHTVDESFEAMLRAIQHAERRVRLETYIYTASAIGERFREALVQACQRGVEVKVLVDAFGSITLPDRFWDSLRNSGGQFRWFNPLSLDRYVIRNHRKLLVCDDDFAFVGGFNIASQYEGDGVQKGWHDFGLQVRGPLARELAETFESLFALADFRHQRFIRFRKARFRRAISMSDGQIILTGPGRGQAFLKNALVQDILRAREIRIIAAYFLPTWPVRQALKRAARRGCKVQIILAGKSDVPLSHLAGRCFYQQFLRAGLELYEYQPQILHAKMLVFDDVVYAGSANLDRRSFYINYELMLRLPNPELAAEARAMFENDLAHCRRIDRKVWRKSRSFWNKLVEGWALFLLARVDPFIARRQLKHLR